MKKTIFLISLFLILQISVNAFADTNKVHNIWNNILKENVSNKGEVNYKSIKKNEINLKVYLNKLSSINPEKLKGNEQLAFWINAYNAYTIKLIIDNYPIKSIKKIWGPWDKKFIEINNKKYSLNNIEHDIIRKEFDEPRIHFALVCAAKSCPKLDNKAYYKDELDKHLDEQAIEFINNKSKNDISKNSIKLSKLFSWYKSDFTKKSSLIEYLNKYSKVKINPKAKVSDLKYNWDLNQK